MRVETEICEYKFDGASAEVHSCYYCGNPADTIDHVPPQCVRPLMRSDPAAFGKYHFYEVDCCKECNSGLNKKLWTLKERKAYIGKWLQRRYKKILKIPDWTEAELQEVSPELQKRIQQSLRLREVVKRRLAWASPKLARSVSAKPTQPKQPTEWYSSAESFNARGDYTGNSDDLKNCLHCNNPFWPKALNQIFCSVECRDLMRHPPHPFTYTCLFCGEVRQTNNFAKKYCDAECRVAFQMAFQASINRVAWPEHYVGVM